MRIRPITDRTLSFGILAAACVLRGFAGPVTVGQEPARIRDGLEFRSRAATSGILVRLGDAGRRLPGTGSVRWSPDSRQLLAMPYHGSPVVLDARSGEVLMHFRGAGEVTLDGAATWTARHSILLSGYVEDTIYREVPGAGWGKDESLDALAGRYLVASSKDGSRAIFEGEGSEWLALDLRTMEAASILPASLERTTWAQEIALRGDGSTLAAVGRGASGPYLEVHDLEGGAARAKPEAGFTKLTFTRSFLAASGSDETEDISARVTFLPEAQMLAATLGGWVALLDQASGAEVRMQKASDAAVLGLDAAGAFLLTLDAAGVLRSWSTPGMEVVGEIEGLRAPVEVAAAPDGRGAAVLDEAGRIHLFHLSEGGHLRPADARPGDALAKGASSVFFGSDPNELLVGTPDGVVLRLDLATLRGIEVPSRVYQLTEEVSGFAEWPRGHRIAFQDDGARHVDKRKRGEFSRPDLVHLRAGRFRPAVSADGLALLADGWSGEIEFREWLVAPVELPGLEAPTSAALSPEGRTAALVDGSELRLYSTGDMALLYEGGADGIPGADREDLQVSAVAGFLDEHHLVVQYEDCAVRIVNTSGDVVSSLDVPEEYSFLMDEVQPIVSADGRWLLCAGAEDGLRVFDLDSESLVLAITGKAWAEDVRDWALSSDGARLAVVTDDGGLELWDFPRFMELAQQIADGDGLPVATGMDSPRDRAWRSLLAGERLRRDGRPDQAVAAYIDAEIAAPFGMDALGVRSMQRRVLAGVARCGVPAEAWLSVRAARAEHRLKETQFGGALDPDLTGDSETLALLMDTRRGQQEPGRWSSRSGIRSARPSSAGTKLLGSLRTPNFKRSVSILASAEVTVGLWKATVEDGGEAAGLRARLRALDRLSMEPRSAACAGLLGDLPAPGAAESALGRAWLALGEALDRAGLPISRDAARDQARVRLRDVEVAPRGPSPAWERLGAARRNPGSSFGSRDARRVQEALEWADSGEWMLVEEGGEAIESFLNYVFEPSERLSVAGKLRAGDRELSVRARMTGDHWLGVAFGDGAVQVTCRFEGPVAHVRAFWAESGEEILAGERQLAGPVWAPFDLSVAIDASRSQLTVQVGASAPLRGAVAPEGFAGRVSLLLGALESPGEYAMRGYRLE